MNTTLTCIVLLLLAGCATNQQPAEVVSSRKKVLRALTKSDYYLVKTGDTLASIAAHFSISQADILKLNKLPEGVQLVPGQRLLLKARNKQEEQRLADDIVVKPLDDLSQIPESVSISEKLPSEVITTNGNPSTPVASGSYVIPVQGTIIKSFGVQPDGTINKGINIAAPKGVPVRSIYQGVVRYVGSKADGYGKMVMIKHDGKEIISVYSHLNSIDVKQGAIVSAGSKIGTVGSTGGVSQPQLNLQIRSFNKQPIDPTLLIPGLG